MRNALTAEEINELQNVYTFYKISFDLLDPDTVMKEIRKAKKDGLSGAEAVHAGVLAALKQQIVEGNP